MPGYGPPGFPSRRRRAIMSDTGQIARPLEGETPLVSELRQIISAIPSTPQPGRMFVYALGAAILVIVATLLLGSHPNLIFVLGILLVLLTLPMVFIGYRYMVADKIRSIVTRDKDAHMEVYESFRSQSEQNRRTG